MEDWRQALENFIGEWKKKDFVEAALITGSYAVGLETERSDVDVYIILSDDVNWRERGNVLVDGWCFNRILCKPSEADNAIL